MARPKILLVDDDVLFGKIMQGLCDRQNITLTYVKTVQDAYRLSDWEYDLAIIDYDLGRVTGVQLANFLEHWLKPESVMLISACKTLDNQAWPKCVKGFITKADGAEHILSEAKRMI
jgi:DNA-binding response OmpR family regulator